MLTLVTCGPDYTVFSRAIAGRTTGGHTNTERGYLPILASKLTTALSEFANKPDCVSQAATTSMPHSGGPTCVLTEQERQALRSVGVLVSEADRHPLERM